MTLRLLTLVIMGLAATAAFVAISFWHRRQLDADLEGHGEQDRWGHDPRPFTVRGERAEQASDGEGLDSREEYASRESLKTTD